MALNKNHSEYGGVIVNNTERVGDGAGNLIRREEPPRSASPGDRDRALSTSCVTGGPAPRILVFVARLFPAGKLRHRAVQDLAQPVAPSVPEVDFGVLAGLPVDCLPVPPTLLGFSRETGAQRWKSGDSACPDSHPDVLRPCGADLQRHEERARGLQGDQEGHRLPYPVPGHLPVQGEGRHAVVHDALLPDEGLRDQAARVRRQLHQGHREGRSGRWLGRLRLLQADLLVGGRHRVRAADAAGGLSSLPRRSPRRSLRVPLHARRGPRLSPARRQWNVPLPSRLPLPTAPTRVLPGTPHDGRGHGLRAAPPTALPRAHGASGQRPGCPVHSRSGSQGRGSSCQRLLQPKQPAQRLHAHEPAPAAPLLPARGQEDPVEPSPPSPRTHSLPWAESGAGADGGSLVLHRVCG